MNRIATTLTIAAAFAAGCAVTHSMQPARAAAENITAQIIHTQDFSGDTLGPANAGGMHSKMFVSADGATVSIQDGNVGNAARSRKSCYGGGVTPGPLQAEA